ncbi:ABC transporter permease [Pasteurella canis]|uniref:ABC transporter permease n=1 Tax=Pasteurella canis TaxID=753 RepID=UPI000D97D5C1|nr:ABC transporter permease subunit [Pasteurella canis]SPY33473.1 peptide transport system permease SapB [Pasteurella canis]
MIVALLRQVFLIIVTLLILSLVSYIILIQDPLNEELTNPNFFQSYINYIQHLIKWDLGITYNGGDSLNEIIQTVLPPTLELCFTAILLAILFGIPLGLIGAMNRHNIMGKSIHTIAALGLSMPVFWIAPIALYFSAIHSWEISAIGQYNLLYAIKPITGFPMIDVWFIEEFYKTKVIQNVLQHLVLPTLVLTILPTMEITRIVQQRAEEVVMKNYVKTATTRGWSQHKILRKYILRNTLPLLIPQTTRLFTLVLTQCMLVESTFGWPGIGRWLIDAVTQQDYNSISVGVIVIGLCIIIVDIFSDSVAFILDPFNKKGWYAR